MNKYVLMLAASALIAAAPAYYAFQAQAEEAEPAAARSTLNAKPTVADESSADQAAASDDAAAAAAHAQTPAAGTQEPSQTLND